MTHKSTFEPPKVENVGFESFCFKGCMKQKQ